MSNVLALRPSQTGMSNISTCEHSPQEWEAQRERFVQLYIAEDRSLSEVKSIMSSQYNFNATDRPYKRRIAAWQLDKNIKDGDMKVMLRKELKRKRDGKESEFQIYGKPVPSQKMKRFVQRKGVTHNEILQEQTATPPTPPYITCRTPNPAQFEGGEDTDRRPPLGYHEKAVDRGAQGSINHSPLASDGSGVETSIQDRISCHMQLEGELTTTDETAYLAAQITCFLWFNEGAVIEHAESWTSSSKISTTANFVAPTTLFLE